MATPMTTVPETDAKPSGDTTVVLNTRTLFMQLTVFTGCGDVRAVISAMRDSGLSAVVYESLNDPTGVGVLTFDTRPEYFIERVRPAMLVEPFRSLVLVPGLTMVGRSYLVGYETDLEETLINRPRSRVLAPENKWAVWYPLRRAGIFTQLPQNEQRAILQEHGTIGQAFGRAGYAQDVRLACHGLDQNDNDFVIGLVGSELQPLSALVERMRKTVQTAKYLERLGPFFVGHVAWQSPA